MEMIIKKTIGKSVYTFVFAGSNLYEVITESQKLSFPDVEKCGCCGSDDLILGTHLGKDDKGNESFKYTDIKCRNCKGSVTFGQPKKDPDTFYLRTNEAGELAWKKFSANQQEPPAQKNTAPPANKTNSKPAPVNNPANKVNQAYQGNQGNQGNQGKLSKNALILASSISIADSEEKLSRFADTILKNKHLTDDDKNYLRAEYSRRLNILKSGSMQQMVN